MSKQTGITNDVLNLISARNEAFTIHELLEYFPEPDYNRLQIANASNYLAREGRITREGYAGHFIYKALPVSSPPVDEVDILDRLLTVMAEAEPVLRRLQAAHKA